MVMTIEGKETRDSAADAPPPPPWDPPGPVGEAPPTPASRSVLLVLLFILICGQAFWVFRRLYPTSPFALNAPTPPGTTAPPSPLASTAPPTAAGASAPTKPAVPGPVPKNPTLGVDDLCLALGGADSRVALDLDAARRLKLVDMLRKLAFTEDQRLSAVEQMRSTFTDEQAKKIPDLIRQGPYADLEGDRLRDEATRTLTKDAHGATAPTTIAAQAPSASVLDWDQSLRGAMALDSTPNILSDSQAAQILDAIPKEKLAAENTRTYLTAINTILQPQEKQKIYKFRQALHNRQRDVLNRTPGVTVTRRLLQFAISALEGGAQ